MSDRNVNFDWVMFLRKVSFVLSGEVKGTEEEGSPGVSTRECVSM